MILYILRRSLPSRDWRTWRRARFITCTTACHLVTMEALWLLGNNHVVHPCIQAPPMLILQMQSEHFLTKGFVAKRCDQRSSFHHMSEATDNEWALTFTCWVKTVPVQVVNPFDLICVSPGVSFIWELGWAWASVGWRQASRSASWATQAFEAQLSSQGFLWAWSSSWFLQRSWVSTGSSLPSFSPRNKHPNISTKRSVLYVAAGERVKWGKNNCKKFLPHKMKEVKVGKNENTAP